MRSKFFIMLVYSLCLCFAGSFLSLAIYGAFFVVAVAALFYLDLNRETTLLKTLLKVTFRVSIPVYILAVFSFLSNSLLLTDGGFVFTNEGVFRGSFFAIRMILLVWFSLLIANTISFEEFSDLFGWVLKPLKCLKVPVKELSLTAAIALRFIPEAYFEFDSIRGSAWARGASMDRGSCFKRVSAYGSCMVPLIVRMLQRSEALSDALTVRCLGLHEDRDKIFDSWAVAEVIVLIASAALLIAVSCILA